MAISSEQVQRIFRKTERELARLSSEKHAKSVHGFRTSARRLETLLEDLSLSRNRNQKKLLKMLRGIRRRAGTCLARDSASSTSSPRTGRS